MASEELYEVPPLPLLDPPSAPARRPCPAPARRPGSAAGGPPPPPCSLLDGKCAREDPEPRCRGARRAGVLPGVVGLLGSGGSPAVGKYRLHE
ncbi:hypothetical protein PAL_GLEAN10016497 [Pteropus alecto]|uniref:Uncharacterized protein n=1 Tax=Pteropus alecto TaxID=9402 RepID=L5KU83_PTEAL|nr:hypothetical protein PAL_GLEAN10016497 [Pteropus alecto]